MTELDAELIPLVLDVINEVGKVFTYTVVGESTYDPATQTSTPDTTVLPDIKMAPPEDASGFSVANGLAQVGDKKIYVPAAHFLDLALEPSPQDLVEFDGKVWTVKSVKSYFSGELPCLYQMGIGK